MPIHISSALRDPVDMTVTASENTITISQNGSPISVVSHNLSDSDVELSKCSCFCTCADCFSSSTRSGGESEYTVRIRKRRLHQFRKRGREIIHSHIFPLLSKSGELVITCVLFATAVIATIVSLIPFTGHALRGPVPALNAVRLALSLFALLLSSIDLGLKIWSWCKSICNTHDYEQVTSSQTRNSIKKYSDVFRSLLAEAIIYPLLICDILEQASSRLYSGDGLSKFTFARFIVSVVWQVLHVYIIRLVVLGATIWSLEQLRRGCGGTTDAAENRVDHEDKKRARRGLIIEIYFFIHVLCQMLTQALMLAVIWVTVDCENPPTDGSNEGTLNISPFTWIMIVFGFLLPISGTLTFFISTYGWVRDFPIDFMLNLLSSLRHHGQSVSEYGISNIRSAAQRNLQRIDTLIQEVENHLREGNNHVCKKIFRPVFSPFPSIVSCNYYILLLVFITTLSLSLGGVGTSVCSFIDIGHVSLYVTFILFVHAVNLIVVLISYWWMVCFPCCSPIVLLISLISTVSLSCVMCIGKLCRRQTPSSVKQVLKYSVICLIASFVLFCVVHLLWIVLLGLNLTLNM